MHRGGSERAAAHEGVRGSTPVFLLSGAAALIYQVAWELPRAPAELVCSHRTHRSSREIRDLLLYGVLHDKGRTGEHRCAKRTRHYDHEVIQHPCRAKRVTVRKPQADEFTPCAKLHSSYLAPSQEAQVRMPRIARVNAYDMCSGISVPCSCYCARSTEVAWLYFVRPSCCHVRGTFARGVPCA